MDVVLSAQNKKRLIMTSVFTSVVVMLVVDAVR